MSVERTTKSWLIICNYVVRHGDCVNHVKVHDILSKMEVHLFNLKLTENCVRSILTGLLN